MDAALFLLDQGVEPSHIQWIMPNDAWLFDRAQIQPGRLTEDGLGTQLEMFASAHSMQEIFELLEQKQRLLRLDTNVWPTKYRCATVSLDELDRLRKIEDVVRLGRVTRIDTDAIVLEQGTVPTHPDKLARRLHRRWPRRARNQADFRRPRTSRCSPCSCVNRSSARR